MYGYNKPTRLSDILAGETQQNLAKQWESTEAAPDFVLLPSGTYEAHIQAIELFNARTGTPGVKVTFRLAEGEHAGRNLYSDLWLTPAALPQTKRDLGKLGVQTLEQLESAKLTPGRIRCRVRVALRRGDDGSEYNSVRGFDFVKEEDPRGGPVRAYR